MRRALRLASTLLLIWTTASGGDEAPASRVVTLSPHLTELVFDAGAGDRLVGVVEYSDYPPAALGIPRIGDAFRFDRERLADARPDLVLAWEGGTPESAIEQLIGDGYRVETIRTSEPEGIARALERIGELTGTASVAAPKAAAFRREMAELEAEYSRRPPVRVFFQISARPLYTVGSGQIIDRVIALCGGVNVFGSLRQLAPVVTEEAVVAADPQIMLTTSPEADPLGRWSRFPDIAAVRTRRLHEVEGDWLSRQGLRLVHGTRQVCTLIAAARAGG
jgi:iron complex transport system substrate-binding protein